MANEHLIPILRETIKGAETGSHFITKVATLGTRLESIQFSATKGDKVLTGLGIETSLAMTGGTVTVAAAKQGAIVDDLRIRVDNELRMDSTDATMLIEFADLVLDKVQSDTTLSAAGTARSYHIIPISGAGGSDVTVDIDVASEATMYSVGTFGAASITLTPYYTSIPIPVFSIKTGSATPGGTGNYKLQVTGDFVGNGYLDTFIVLGDGTLVVDDIVIVQSDGLQLFNAKYAATKAYWQGLFQKTIYTYTIVGMQLEPTKVFDINDQLKFDVDTAGTMKYILVTKNSPTSTDAGVNRPVPTPREPTAPQPPMNTTQGRISTRNYQGQQIQNVAGGTGKVGVLSRVRKTLNF